MAEQARWYRSQDASVFRSVTMHDQDASGFRSLPYKGRIGNKLKQNRGSDCATVQMCPPGARSRRFE